LEINDFITSFAPEGVWAILSLILIFYIIKGQEKRDERQDTRDAKYQSTIADLAKALQDMGEIKKILERKLK
jgi:membrane protein implicated in regulation of membrane protease activity